MWLIALQFHTHTHLIHSQRWYKIDFFISWKNYTYNIRVDDVARINRAPFRGVAVDRLGLYSYHNTRMYADEIFAGDEQTTNFKCPVTLAGGADGLTPQGVQIRRPWENSWGPESLGPANESFHEKVRHSDSFFALLPRFAAENGYGGLIPNDGPGNTEFISGVTQRFADGDYERQMGGVEISVFMYDPLAVPSFSEDAELTSRTTSKKSTEGFTSGEHGCTFGSKCAGLTGKTGRYYWYGEHHDSEDGREFLRGSVVACSTTDFINWRNEGTMLHFSNLTDDTGRTFTSHQDNLTDLIVERPKVIYNENTGQYVMWMHLDNRNNTLRLASVAVSDYPNGPFTFVRSFLPDTNETQDMTVMKVGTDAALVRTYYETTEFVLASPVMQPLWESVKKPKGVPVPEYVSDTGEVYMEKRNFGLNYHRAFYHSQYDDNDDICYQRLRAEDRPFSYKKPDDECTRQAPSSVDYKNRFGVGLDVMDPPVLTYDRSEQRQVYFPEDLVVQEPGSLPISYKGGTYEDCHNRVEPFDGKDVACGFGNDGLSHPKVDPTNVESEAFFGTSRQASGELLPQCNPLSAYPGEPGRSSYTGTANACQLPAVKVNTRAKREAWCTPHARLAPDGKPYGADGPTPPCDCEPEAGGSGCGDYPAIALSYSDFIKIELGFVMTAAGTIVNDDQPERPARPGQMYSHCCDMLQNQTGSVHPTLFYTTQSKTDQCLSGNDGAGFPQSLRSRYKYAGLTHVHDYWSPNSVPNLRGHIQPWSQNYMDGNIADNPIHGTEPDQLIAPSKVVFTRRAKYVVLTKLSDNYLELTRFNNLFEGEAINRSLNSILDDFGQFGWGVSDVSGGTTEHHQIWATDVDQKKATSRNRSFPEQLELQRYIDAGAPLDDKPPFDAEEVDWLDRYWQYDDKFGDRRASPVNFLDQINGRRQWHGRNGSNTLKDRAERMPLDRNCIYEGAVPPVWTNQLGSVASLYKIQGTWGDESAGGGTKGSSKQYNYDDDEIKYMHPTQTSNDPLLVNGIGYVGKLRSWARRSEGRLSVPGNDVGTELGFTDTSDMMNYLSSHKRAHCQGDTSKSQAQCVAPNRWVEDRIVSRTFSSRINPQCSTLEQVWKNHKHVILPNGDVSDAGFCTDTPEGVARCAELVCSKEKAFDDDYYVEHQFMPEEPIPEATGPPKSAEVRRQETEALEAKRDAENKGFNGFYSAGNESSFGSWIGVHLKQRTQNPIVKVFTSWTTETLDMYFRDVIKPSVEVPSISLSMWLASEPVHERDDFPLQWMEQNAPCGSINGLMVYPDHDGSTQPAMCGGRGEYLYIVNNTADALDGKYYLALGQVDVVGTLQFDRPPIPHPPRINEHVCEKADGTLRTDASQNYIPCLSSCPVGNKCIVADGSCEMPDGTIQDTSEYSCTGAKPSGLDVGGCTNTEKCVENPRHHGSLGTGPWRYSVGQRAIEFPDTAQGFVGFEAPGWLEEENAARCGEIPDPDGSLEDNEVSWEAANRPVRLENTRQVEMCLLLPCFFLAHPISL